MKARAIYRLLAPFICLANLTACAVPPGGYRNTSSAQLCVDYMTLPSGNINQNERANELARRGENCQAYTAIAQARNNANAAAMQAYQQQMYQQQMYQQQQKARQPTYTNCQQYGNSVQCTTQ